MLGYKIYGKSNCQGCDQAKALLESKGIGYEYVDVMKTPSAQALFRENGFRSVPQIYYNDQWVCSGANELSLFLHSLEGHGS